MVQDSHATVTDSKRGAKCSGYGGLLDSPVEFWGVTEWHTQDVGEGQKEVLGGAQITQEWGSGAESLRV